MLTTPKAVELDKAEPFRSSWVAIKNGLKGFRVLMYENGVCDGGGYKIGDKKTPNVNKILTALPISRNTKLSIDSKKPSPTAINKIRKIIIGVNRTSQDGTKPYQINTIVTGSNRMKKSIKG